MGVAGRIGPTICPMTLNHCLSTWPDSPRGPCGACLSGKVSSSQSAGERLVLDAGGLVSRSAEFLASEGFVVAEVALEPTHLRVTFERQCVGRYAVQEPAIMADNDCTTGVHFECILERAQGFDVEVVGWFIKK